MNGARRSYSLACRNQANAAADRHSFKLIKRSMAVFACAPSKKIITRFSGDAR